MAVPWQGASVSGLVFSPEGLGTGLLGATQQALMFQRESFPCIYWVERGSVLVNRPVRGTTSGLQDKLAL